MIAAPSGTEWTGEPLGRTLKRQTPEDMANKTLAEKRDLNERTRLTWNRSKVPIRGEGKFVGDVCLSLPYVLIGKQFYIQNCRIFKSNGVEVSKDQLAALTDPLTYQRVISAFENHVNLAVDHDPQLCKYCKLVRFEGLEDMMQHVVNEHPDVVAKMAGVQLDSPKQPTDSIDFWCEPCDRTFKNASGLRLHRLKVHDKAA